MNASESAVALRILEDAAKVLWKVFSRFLVSVFGVVGTALLQAWLVVKVFPAAI